MYGEETLFERQMRDFEAIENDSNKNVDEQETQKELNETGEMSKEDIQLDGEHYEWAKSIEDNVKRIETLTDGKLNFEMMRPFDKYLGPYARVSIDGKGDSVWDANVSGGKYLYLENRDWVGTVEELADAIDGKEEAVEKVGNQFRELSQRQESKTNEQDKNKNVDEKARTEADIKQKIKAIKKKMEGLDAADSDFDDKVDGYDREVEKLEAELKDLDETEESKTDEQEEVDQRELPGYEDESGEGESAKITVDPPVDFDEALEILHEEWESALVNSKVDLVALLKNMLEFAESSQVNESEVDEKKKPPTCKKCNKAHWPFKKCSTKESEEQDEVNEVFKTEEDVSEFVEKNAKVTGTADTRVSVRYGGKLYQSEDTHDLVVQICKDKNIACESKTNEQEVKEQQQPSEGEMWDRFEELNSYSRSDLVKFWKMSEIAVLSDEELSKVSEEDLIGEIMSYEFGDLWDEVGFKGQSADESKTDEKKKPPTCKKCNKAHWPFKKCSETNEVNEDYANPEVGRIVDEVVKALLPFTKVSKEQVEEVVGTLCTTDIGLLVGKASDIVVKELGEEQPKESKTDEDVSGWRKATSKEEVDEQEEVKEDLYDEPEHQPEEVEPTDDETGYITTSSLSEVLADRLQDALRDAGLFLYVDPSSVSGFVLSTKELDDDEIAAVSVSNESKEVKEEDKVDEQLVPHCDDLLFIQQSVFAGTWDLFKTSEGSRSATQVFTFVSEEAAAGAGQKIADAIGGEFRGKEDPRAPEGRQRTESVKESKMNKPFSLRDMWDLKESEVLGTPDEQEEVKEEKIEESTRSRVGIVLPDGSIESVYVHFDGMPSGVGAKLKQHYTDEGKIKELLALGDISTLEPEIGSKHDFEDRPEDETTFYGRDRGESGNDSKTVKSHDEFVSLAHNTNANYAYLFTDGKWQEVLQSE